VPDSGRDWMVAAGHKFLSNLYSLIPRQGFEGTGLEAVTLLFLLSGIPLGAWLWLRRRDAFALGVSLALSLLLIADLCLYGMWHYRGIHAFLLMEPFVAMLWGTTITLWTKEPGPVVRSLLVPCCFVIGVAMTVSIWQTQKDATVRAKEDTSFLESVIGDSQQMVVSPFWLSLDYVNEHYPQRWAFVPANCPTMQLLDAKEGIGTLIVPAQPELEAEYRSCRTGLKFDGEEVWREECTGSFVEKKARRNPISLRSAQETAVCASLSRNRSALVFRYLGFRERIRFLKGSIQIDVIER